MRYESHRSLSVAEIFVKTASPFDLDQILTLLQFSDGSNPRPEVTVDTLHEALWGKGSAIKALVARQVMQVVGCVFYQVTFSVPSGCYVIHEVSFHVHPEHLDSGIGCKLREALKNLDIQPKERVSILKTLAAKEVFAS